MGAAKAAARPIHPKPMMHPGALSHLIHESDSDWNGCVGMESRLVGFREKE